MGWNMGLPDIEHLHRKRCESFIIGINFSPHIRDVNKKSPAKQGFKTMGWNMGLEPTTS